MYGNGKSNWIKGQGNKCTKVVLGGGKVYLKLSPRDKYPFLCEMVCFTSKGLVAVIMV